MEIKTCYVCYGIYFNSTTASYRNRYNNNEVGQYWTDREKEERGKARRAGGVLVTAVAASRVKGLRRVV